MLFTLDFAMDDNVVKRKEFLENGPPSSTEDFYGSLFERGVTEAPYSKLSDFFREQSVSGGWFDSFWNGSKAQKRETLTPEQANQEYGLSGALSFSTPVTREYAELRSYIKQRENIQRTNIEAFRGSAFDAGAGFLTELAGGILDPLNIGSAFVPIIGPARAASWAAKYGKLGSRVLTGAIEGSVGSAMLLPAEIPLNNYFDKDYSTYDYILGIGMNAAGGSVLHTLAGVAADVLKSGAIAPETHNKALQTAVGQFVSGEKVDVNAIIELGKLADPEFNNVRYKYELDSASRMANYEKFANAQEIVIDNPLVELSTNAEIITNNPNANPFIEALKNDDQAILNSTPLSDLLRAEREQNDVDFDFKDPQVQSFMVTGFAPMFFSNMETEPAMAIAMLNDLLKVAFNHNSVTPIPQKLNLLKQFGFPADLVDGKIKQLFEAQEYLNPTSFKITTKDASPEAYNNALNKQMTIDEAKALQAYLGSGYYEMNKVLSDPLESISFSKYDISKDPNPVYGSKFKRVTLLKQIFDKGIAVIASDNDLFRGLKINENFNPDADLYKLNVGDIYNEKSFMSTSIDPLSAFEFLPDAASSTPFMLKITGNVSGAKGLEAFRMNVEGIDSIITHEKEIILPPGTSFRITTKEIIDPKVFLSNPESLPIDIYKKLVEESKFTHPSFLDKKLSLGNKVNPEWGKAAIKDKLYDVMKQYANMGKNFVYMELERISDEPFNWKTASKEQLIEQLSSTELNSATLNEAAEAIALQYHPEKEVLDFLDEVVKDTSAIQEYLNSHPDPKFKEQIVEKIKELDEQVSDADSLAKGLLQAVTCVIAGG